MFVDCVLLVSLMVSLDSGANVRMFGTYYMIVHSISIDKLEIKCVQGSLDVIYVKGTR
jgi:hypothetical protein